MSFGSSTPIAVRIIGTDYDEVRKHAEKIAAEMKRNSFLRDVSFEQTLDYPTVEVDIDRELAGLIGVTPEHVKRALVMATASTRFTQPQLLDRREDRLRLPGANPGAAPADGRSRRTSRSCRWSRSTRTSR